MPFKSDSQKKVYFKLHKAIPSPGTFQPNRLKHFRFFGPAWPLSGLQIKIVAPSIKILSDNADFLAAFRYLSGNCEIMPVSRIFKMPKQLFSLKKKGRFKSQPFVRLNTLHFYQQPLEMQPVGNQKLISRTIRSPHAPLCADNGIPFLMAMIDLKTTCDNSGKAFNCGDV